MDPMISLGQKNTLAEYMILSGAENRPPMLDKDLYDSWKIEENGVIRTKKYAELSTAKKIQVDCDMKATNIILQGLPADIYSLEKEISDNDMEHYTDKNESNFKLNTKFLNSLPPEWNSGFAFPVFSPGDDLIAYLNKADMENQATIQDGRVTVQQVQGRQGENYSGNTYKSNATSSRGNTTSGQARVVKCYNCQSEGHMAGQCTQPKRLRNAAWHKEKAMLAEAQKAGQILDEEQLVFLADLGILASQTQTVIPHNASFQTEDLDTYNSDCDDLSTTQAVLMANISNYGSDVISEVPNSETYLNDMDNQSVHALQDFEQSPVMDFTDNEISSDSNIIPYSQYLQETQQATVQDTNLQAQQDSMILSVIEQMSEQMINHVNNWEKANKEQNNESITAELERYKERVKTFEQRLNIDLSSREKMIDSQMDDMIREKLALKEQIDSLEQNLSKQIKEKESLFKTFTVFKNESKEKENKYMENEIDLEKKIKELDNIVYKVGQSAQTVHMLTKPQAFYDNTHKQALGYQNPFYLRKAQRIKPTLYDGAVISKTHVAMPVIDDEETLILEEESRSKMFEKAKDPEVIAKKISHKPIDYEKLNSLIEDFETRFSPQQELSAEQAFWFHTFNPTIEPSYLPPVIVDVPSELPKKRTTPSALEEEYFEINDLKARLQDKDTTISKLKDTIKSLKMNTKEKNVHHDKCDLEPINEELENIVAKLLSENEQLCNEINHVKQELLVYVQDTCPNAITPSTKKVVVTPMNNVKKVRLVEPLTSSSNIKRVESSNTLDYNTPVLSSTRVKYSISICGSKPPGNKKNNRISQTPSRNKKNKVEAQPRKVNNMNRVVKPVCDVDVKQSLSNANSDILCATYNKSMFDGVHNKCLLDLVQNGNNHAKSAKKHKKQNI
ncbi:retrovirus-related pol polyprotein from transposon TNT 1-94 [Tanacetum coccineum]|uniref:Retrovirus-related pol polyprotein from transposon TNT 1-94 n=1 Tax=Tanacetum coccineum TaxID=301880 RepID=A0ABQ5IHF4_9ASTR